MASAAADRWRVALAAWAIPEEILAAAPECPWHFPVSVFASRADAAGGARTPSTLRALEALPTRGSVLDVGCGAGAAALALAGRAARMIGVDTSTEMLRAFEERAATAHVDAVAVRGAWPAVAGGTEPADVAVCHHVAYNAHDLRPFVERLTDHARERVVMELTREHPQTGLNTLWLRFHGVVRPTVPTADDAVAVVREAGLDVRREDWTAPRPGGFASRSEMVASVRRLLCLPPDRDGEVEEALGEQIRERDGRFGFPDRPAVTLWWDGAAE